MALENANKTNTITEETQNNQRMDQPVRLLFGVDSKIQSNDLWQNNIDMFEWVTKNKIYPIFWGRNIIGENSLTKDEIKFLHDKGCKIAAICNTSDPKKSEEQGKIFAKKVILAALELGISLGTAIFLEIAENEDITKNYLRGFAKAMLVEGYIPGFKANTDARFEFDCEFSRGMKADKDVFGKCLIWAVAPSLAEYDGITTTHLIHPDTWKPFAPSGISRNDIAIWQYGKDCHPIYDDYNKEVVFNVSVLKDSKVILNNLF